MKSIVFLLLGGFAMFVMACEKVPYEISTENVERILKTLSDDAMMGRKAMTPGIDSAAAFLAGEFDDIGLTALEGEDNYFQEFSLYNISATQVKIEWNGTPVADSLMLVRTGAEGIDQTYYSEDILRVEEGADFRQSLSEMRSSGKTVAMVHESHAPIFSQYARFFNRPATSMNLEELEPMVMILGSGSVDSVHVQVVAEVSEKPLKNVAGMIPGRKKDEIILFSAHYDHLGVVSGDRITEGDSIANGANDDASGTTAVVELARYFMDRGVPERTLMFVAFTAEEMGGYGSQYFSKELNPDQIVAMFNIEMIGKPATSGPNSAWITGFDKSNFGEMLQKSVEGTEYEFYADPYPSQNLFYRSDNATLARLGVPAHTISTTPIDVDPDYHQVSDEFGTLDVPHMTNTIKAISAGAQKMISGELTPNRVDPDDIN